MGGINNAYSDIKTQNKAKYEQIKGVLIMIIVLLIALVLLSVILGYSLGRYKAEREFAEVIFWLEETGALKPLLEVDDEDFGE